MTKSPLFVLFLLLTSAITLPADNTYPVTFSPDPGFSNGFLQPLACCNDSVSGLYIEPGFIGQPDQISLWNKSINKLTKNIYFSSGTILKLVPVDSSIVIIWTKDQRVFAELFILNPLSADQFMSSANIAELKVIPGSIEEAEKQTELTHNNDKILFRLGTFFYAISIDEGRICAGLISSKVNSFTAFGPESEYQYSYIERSGGWSLVVFVSKDDKSIYPARLRISDRIRLISVGNKLVVVSSSPRTDFSFVQLIDSKLGRIAETMVHSTSSLLNISVDTDNILLHFLASGSNTPLFVTCNFRDYKQKSRWHITTLPSGYFEPSKIISSGDTTYIIFRNGLVGLEEHEIISSDYFSVSPIVNNQYDIFVTDYGLMLSSGQHSIALYQTENRFWLINRFLQTTGRVFLPALLGLMFLLLAIIYVRKSRMLKTILELPTAGFVYIISKNGKLTRANDMGKSLLGITNSVPMGKLFRYYTNQGGYEKLTSLVERALGERNTFNQKIIIGGPESPMEIYFTVLPYRSIFGKMRGLIITGLDITEELERKRLNNWAQLAHDMQTNLSTIRLNAEHIDVSQSEDNDVRRKKIIHQVVLLIQRVRDIVTVGRSNELERQIVPAVDICQNVRGEFDETVFPFIEFELNLEPYNISCDVPKMTRALRNAVENAIKALGGEQGKIIISCYKQHGLAFFSVKDTGMGMDNKAKDKMMKPYFTTSRSSGGHGIGTMIMQHVMELHGGKITVNSEPGKGTELVFELPNYAYNRNQKKSR